MRTIDKLSIESRAQANPLIEVCGIAVMRSDLTVELIHCDNVSPTPDQSFEISRDDNLRAHRTGRLLWAYHSHPHLPAAFSEADIEYANRTAIPHHLYNVVTKTWREYIPPSYRPTLEGRQFCYGEQDCYALLRDYYRQTHGIYMRDYDRDENSDGREMGRRVLQHIEDEGFMSTGSLSTLTRGDALIFRINGSPQHFGVFLGNSRILHHPLKALSRVDQLDTMWQKRLHTIARYRKGLG